MEEGAMRRFFFAVAALFTVLAVLAGNLAAQEPQKPDKPDAGKTSPLDELKKLAKTCKIEIVTEKPEFPVKTTHGAINGKAADAKKVEIYAGLFVEEFSLYPEAFIKKSKLRRVVFCIELSYAGQLRAAVPDLENNTLYLDVKRGDYSKPYQRGAIHHDFFHMVDWMDDFKLYEDDEWTKLNEKGFKYGTGGVNAQNDPTTGVLTDKYPGFLNHYSTTGVEEDKAEIYCHLIISSGHVAEKVKKDPVLKTKTERMRKLLADFCREMNDAFWEKIGKVKRNDK
jgi:hypothetical protein